jgi:lipopolysaccharide transport system ATP-binding protein
MHVRLAFAVASKLRSDILILDEALAVGDMAFQEKARKNMRDLVAAGRTILFVSHNARLLSQLCHTGIILSHGVLTHSGPILDMVHTYIQQIQNLNDLPSEPSAEADIFDMPRFEHAFRRILKHVQLIDGQGSPCSTFTTGQPFGVRIQYVSADMPFPAFELFIANEFGERVTTISSTHTGEVLDIPENGTIQCMVDDLRLGEGTYCLGVDVANCTGAAEVYNSFDSVMALKFAVRLDGYVAGLAVSAFQGAVHRSQWQIVS